MIQARLVPLDGGRPVRLEKDLTIVGRKRWVCDIFLRSDRVSKLHCMIYKSHGRLLLQDFGSSNGTRVNGQEVTGEIELQHGDQIQFANLDYVVMLHNDRSDEVSEKSTHAQSSLMAEILDNIVPPPFDEVATTKEAPLKKLERGDVFYFVRSPAT